MKNKTTKSYSVFTRTLTTSRKRRTKTSVLSGFTLIELLVVIAIIGLLSSVVVASVNSARTRAKNTNQIRQARQYVNALYLYSIDQNDFPYRADETCLGEGYPGGVCGDFFPYPENAALNAALSPYINLPAPEEGYGCSGGSCYLRGYLYSCLSGSVDDCVEPQLLWGLKGTVDAEDCLPATQSFLLLGDTFCIYTFSDS